MVLVVTAHPDDAELAAGGTIAQLTSKETAVTIAVASLPEAGAAGSSRREAAERAALILGARLIWLEDGRIRQVSHLSDADWVQRLDDLVRETQPVAVISHWIGDSHVDHSTIGRLMIACCRLHRHALYAMRPAELRTPAFMRFRPNTFVDISETYRVKIAALTEFRADRAGFRPLDEAAVNAVDVFHGVLSGCDRAEGFTVLHQMGLMVPPLEAVTGG